MTIVSQGQLKVVSRICIDCGQHWQANRSGAECPRCGWPPGSDEIRKARQARLEEEWLDGLGVRSVPGAQVALLSPKVTAEQLRLIQKRLGHQ